MEYGAFVHGSDHLFLTYYTFRTAAGPIIFPEGAINYIYDNAGQHTETYTDYTDTLYDYDDQGRLWHVTVMELNGTALTTPLVTTYGYDPAGNKTGEVLPNGVTTAYTYDHLNRLTDVVQMKGSQTLLMQQYTLRHDGLRESVTETQLQSDGTTLATINTAWTYDGLGRLTGETVTSSLADQSYSDSFTYDLVGNRMKKGQIRGQSRFLIRNR